MMELSRGGGVPREPMGIFFRTVLLLKNGDFGRNGDQIYMPTQSEMSALRARKGQYKRDVEFHANMSEAMVKKHLEETFPYLKDKRFFCAAKVNGDNNSSRFEFHGRPHLWNGRYIRRNIQGNSVLYILEDAQSDTSGISGSEPETSPEELKLWLQQGYRSEVSIYPKESPLEGGALCRFTFIPKLQPDVTSGRATFENLGTVQLERLSNGDLLGNIPASPVPGLVTVTLYSQHRMYLGQTNIKYYGMEEILKKIVFCPNLTKKIFEEYNKYYSLGGATKQTQHSGFLGFTDPVQLLSLLVYTAAKMGAQQFLEMIFKTSSGRVVFDAYKSNLTLPEVIAKKHGHEVSARYLEGVTKRFSKEIKNGKECSKKIDWPELVKAAEEAEKSLKNTSEEDLKETAYLGDVDTSSESSQRQSSDSEEDISTTLRKASINDQKECDIRLQRDLHINDRKRGTKDQLNVEVHRKNNAEIKAEVQECKQLDLVHGDHAIKANKASLSQSPSLFLKDGEYEGKETVQYRLITACERSSNLRKLTKEKNVYCNMHTDTAGDDMSSGYSSMSSSMLGEVRDYESSSVDSLSQLCSKPLNKDIKTKTEKWKQWVRVHGDHAIKVNKANLSQSLSLLLKDGEYEAEDDRCSSSMLGYNRDYESSRMGSLSQLYRRPLNKEEKDIFSLEGYLEEINGLRKIEGFDNLTDAEKQQDEKDLKELQVMIVKMISRVRVTVESLRVAADKLDEVWKHCKIAHAVGSCNAVVGGGLTIFGGIATIATAGAAAPLLLAGMGIGLAGAGTNILTGFTEAAINQSEIKKAEKDLQETLESYNEVANTIKLWQAKKDTGRLLYIWYLASLNLKFGDHVLKFLQTVVAQCFPTSIGGLTGKIALQAGQAGAQAAKGAGAQVYMQASKRLAGGLIVGVSAMFLVWDAIDLGYTIKEIVEDKGSDAARCFREKADQLESALRIPK